MTFRYLPLSNTQNSLNSKTNETKKKTRKKIRKQKLKKNTWNMIKFYVEKQNRRSTKREKKKC